MCPPTKSSPAGAQRPASKPIPSNTKTAVRPTGDLGQVEAKSLSPRRGAEYSGPGRFQGYLDDDPYDQWEGGDGGGRSGQRNQGCALHHASVPKSRGGKAH